MLKVRPEMPDHSAPLPMDSPGEILDLLKFQENKGEELLQKNFLSMEDVRYWNLFTKEILTKVFGPKPEYIDSIIYGEKQKPYPAFEPESILEKERRKNLEAVVEKLKEIWEEFNSEAMKYEKFEEGEETDGSRDPEESAKSSVENAAEAPNPGDDEGEVDLAANIEATTIEVNERAKTMEGTGSRKVLVIQGEDGKKGMEVLSFLRKLELDPVIPAEQPGQRMRLMEEFEQNPGIVFAITLLTGDDVGYPRGKPEESWPRPKQDLIFELGFLVGRLRQSLVCALHEEGLDLPSEYSGKIFVPFDADGLWRLLIARAMKIAQVQVDLNKAM
jgi:predicted nucleotide-binding protein